MQRTSVNCAILAMFGAGSTFGSQPAAIAGGLSAPSSTLTGSVSVTSVPPYAENSTGPNFDLTTNQGFYSSLSLPAAGYAEGNLSQGIASVEAVTATAGMTGDGLSTTTYTTTFTNSASTAENFNFNFYIGSGTLVVFPTLNYPYTTGSLAAQINAAIVVNGVNAWSYQARLTGTATTYYDFNPNFSFAASSANGPSYSVASLQEGLGEAITFNAYTGSLGLGLLAPGQSEQLSYTLSGATFSQLGDSQLAFYGGALAQIGDPFSVQGQGITSFGVSPASVPAVPEPSPPVIAATGLVLLAGLAKRRRTRRTDQALIDGEIGCSIGV